MMCTTRACGVESNRQGCCSSRQKNSNNNVFDRLVSESHWIYVWQKQMMVQMANYDLAMEWWNSATAAFESIDFSS